MGICTGASEGICEGESLGISVSLFVFDKVGLLEPSFGFIDGDKDGNRECINEGGIVGMYVGNDEGLDDGIVDGTDDFGSSYSGFGSAARRQCFDCWGCHRLWQCDYGTPLRVSYCCRGTI